MITTTLVSFIWILVYLIVLNSLIRMIHKPHLQAAGELNTMLATYFGLLLLGGSIVGFAGLQQTIALGDLHAHAMGELSLGLSDYLLKTTIFLFLPLVAFGLALLTGWFSVVVFFPGRNEVREADGGNLAYFLFKGIAVLAASVLLYLVLAKVLTVFMPVLPVTMIHGL